MEAFGYLALVILGMILGSIGMGGSMLAVPILVYVFSLNMVTASAYALFISGVTSLAGFMLKQCEDFADLRAAVRFGIPSVLSSFVSRKWVVEQLPPTLRIGSELYMEKDMLMLTCFCVLMIVSSAMMITRSNANHHKEARPRYQWLPVSGTFTGLVAGFVGAGGGFLILPSLVVFAGLRFPIAVATALFVIAINSLGGFFGDALNNSIHWTFLLLLTGFCVTGLLIGDLARDKISGIVNQRAVGWIVGMTGVAILLVEWFQ